MVAKKNPELTKKEQLIKSWKQRADYKGYDRSKGSSYNSWRAIVYTKKGAKIGFPESWKNYNEFMNDVQGKWEKGKIATRINAKLPHSKENTYWTDKGNEAINRLIQFEYNGKKQTLLEWAREFNVNYNGLRIRYFKHKKDWTAEDVLFGKKTRKKIILHNTYEHRIKRMCGAYKLRDKKKGFDSNIDSKWMIEFCKQPCFYCGDTNNIGLDRIDNSKGHTKDNVVPCCYECNCARMNNFTHDEMKILGKTIKEIKCKRLHKNN